MKKPNYKWLWEQYLVGDQRDKLVDAIASKGDSETLRWLWEQYLVGDQRDKLVDAMTSLQKKSPHPIGDLNSSGKQRRNIDLSEYDFFIAHASEDKEACVRELAEKLSKKGYKVWYDEFTLTLGDSLRRKIDHGLANSRYGVVILSKSFFEKDWTQKELDGLMAKERDGKKIILPIWHGVTREDVEQFSPILAGRLAASTHKGLDYIVGEIIRAIK